MLIGNVLKGQILAGASPFKAIKYQITIVLAIFLIRLISLIFTTFLVNNLCFDKFSHLKEDIFKKGNR
jgi:putative ABC transport system permease protein